MGTDLAWWAAVSVACGGWALLILWHMGKGG